MESNLNTAKPIYFILKTISQDKYQNIRSAGYIMERANFQICYCNCPSQVH